MKLNLGVGRDSREGWVNVDRQQYEGVDKLWDLDFTPWPWGRCEADEILALDIFEHLMDITAAMDECWRVLAPGGTLRVRGPRAGGVNHYADPTHRRGFTDTSFDYYAANTQHTDTPLVYGVGRWELVRIIGAPGSPNIEFVLRRLP
jgi:predicted SAM-dependent methyltransferase